MATKQQSRRQSTILLLVRHGRTPTTGKVLPGRAKDLHLSDEGRLQANSVAKRIATAFDVSTIYTSPVERARETAAPIAQALGLKPVVAKGIIELDNGDWTGLELTKLAKLPEWKWVQSNPGSFRFPNGESFLEMQARVNDAINSIADNHRGETVVAVSHADPIKMAVVTALRAPLTSLQHVEIATCSVTAISINGANQSVLTVSDTGDFGGLAKK